MKTVAIAYDDGRTELVSEDTLVLAKALKVMADDPLWAPQVKVLATAICFAAAAKEALKNQCPTPPAS